MRKSGVMLVALVLAISSPGFADRHRPEELAASFVKAWNAHDPVTMTDLWTADAQGIDVLGHAATGRAEVARLFVDGDSTLKLTTDISVRPGVGGAFVVEFAGEVTARTAVGNRAQPLVRTFTAVMVWGPDLPGGHHPRGRYFIVSMRAGAAGR